MAYRTDYYLGWRTGLDWTGLGLLWSSGLDFSKRHSCLKELVWCIYLGEGGLAYG